jgi:hypothetical protein
MAHMKIIFGVQINNRECPKALGCTAPPTR